MIIDLLSLIALFAFIAVAFKYLVIGSNKATLPKQENTGDRKPQNVVQQKQYMQNSRQEHSFKKDNGNPFENNCDILKQGKMQANISHRDELKQQNNSNNQDKGDKNQISLLNSIEERSQQIGSKANNSIEEQQQRANEKIAFCQNSKMSFDKEIVYEDYVSPNIIDQNDPLLQQSPLDYAQTQRNPKKEKSFNSGVRQQLSFEQKCQVKDVVSECQNYVAQEIHQIHSNAQRIQITQSPLRKNTKRLKAIKEHYKLIIKQLKNKLDEICIRHNQSIQSMDLSQTINFSQEQSAYLQNYTIGNLEVKVQEVTSLKNELQLHEQILTNIIEEDSKLKDKVRSLQQQNKHLKSALSSSQLKQCSQVDNKQTKQAQSTLKQQGQEKQIKQELKRSRAIQSRIIQMYTSQINHSPNSQISQSQIFPTKSAMSMMSLVFQGALSIGLLGECRFLNQISKKFTIGEIKKCLKQRVVDSQLLYNYGEIQFKNDRSIYYFARGRKNILFLMKLANQNNVAIFVQSIESQRQQQNQLLMKQGKRQKVLLLDLSKKKAFNKNGYGTYQNNHIVFGQSKLCLSQFAPFIVKNDSLENSPLQISDEEVSFLAIYCLTLEDND